MGIGKFNRRPIFYNETYAVDAGGGSRPVESERWEQWAKINDRSGSTSFSQSQDLTTYDYEVEVRSDGRFTSLTGMIYEGQVCKMNSMSIKSEGYKDFFILRFTKTDTWVDLS